MKIQMIVRFLDDAGLPFMGRGPVELLQAIDRLGSINKAAKEMNMSYVKSWKIIKRIEACLGGKILKTEIGGKAHGGSELTQLAEEFLACYTGYENEVAIFAKEKFDEIKDRLETLRKE